ncbi:type VII secretion target [Mycobacterium sp. NPDC004974]
MNQPLAVSIEAMRLSANGLNQASVEFHRGRAGPAVSGASGSLSALETADACRDVGSSLARQAQSLGNDVSEYADKLLLAADRYERGDIEAAESIDFAGPDESPAEDPNATPEQKLSQYERALRDAGVLDGPAEGRYREWLLNAARQDVSPETIVDIARTHDIDPEDFDVFNGMEEVKDADGKSFFLIPSGTSPEKVKKAALMTYILNAGTDYGKAELGPDGKAGTSDDVQNDFEEVPYSAAEVQRIIDRQNANSWSYTAAAGLPYTGAAVATTPNGMLMALGGKPTDWAAFQGGSTYGDIFTVNINDVKNPAEQLRAIIDSGNMWYGREGGVPVQGGLDLDRLLHHEERHSQQWAEKGPVRMGIDYGTGGIIQGKGGVHPLEEDAGLSDGGYH